MRLDIRVSFCFCFCFFFAFSFLRRYCFVDVVVVGVVLPLVIFFVVVFGGMFMWLRCSCGFTLFFFLLVLFCLVCMFVFFCGTF